MNINLEAADVGSAFAQDEHIYGNQSCRHGYLPTVSEFHEAMGQWSTALYSVATLITAVLVLFYVEHLVYTFKNTHSVYRRHINWLACFYPLGALMICLSFVVPRAYNVCAAIKIVFFSLGISHFTDLTVSMFGCEKSMLAHLKDACFTLHVGPFGCCPWLPTPTVTKIRLRGLKWMLWQMPYTQALYYFLVSYWTTAESDPDGVVVLSYVYLVLDVFNLTSFSLAIYALAVLSRLVSDQLAAFNYKRKSRTLMVLLVLLKVSSLVITILGNYGFFPCVPPFINSMTYAHTVIGVMQLMMLAMFGGLEYWQYHTLEFLREVSDKHHTHSHELIIHGEASVCIISEMNLKSHNSRRNSANILPPIVLENKLALDTDNDPNVDEEQKFKDTLLALPAPTRTPSPRPSPRPAVGIITEEEQSQISRF